MKSIKKTILAVVTTLVVATASFAQCNVLFSYAAYFDTVSFVNQSSVSNAHYFWNFGDGTGSNYVNPVHTFPGTGDYLVTLFALDTISKCSSYYEYWVNVIKYSNTPCQPGISDSISNDELYIYNTSSNCNGYNITYSGATSCGMTPNFMPIGLGGSWEFPWHIVCVGEYADNNGNPVGGAYKTAYYYGYSSTRNYGNCSANFEFIVVSQDSLGGQQILFTAMNKKAKSYTWNIAGFGNPIISHYDTISKGFGPGCPGIVMLMTEDSSGCQDTLIQNILADDSSYTVLGVNNIIANKAFIKVYPNPSKGAFTLVIASEAKQSPNTVEVYNMLGEKVYASSIQADDNSINLSNQPNGVYLYRVISETGELVGEGKIVFQ